MKARKFKSATAAANVAKVLGMKAHKGAAAKLKDGSRANWYTFTKVRKKK
jgi:hypothetical protein